MERDAGYGNFACTLVFIILFIIPESPRWLLLRGKVARSESIFGKIYSRKERAKKQVEELQAHIANETKSEFKYLFQPGILTAVVAGLCIAILGQFMGVNAVLYYGPTIFENVGLSGGDSLFYQVLIGAVNMGTTVLALLIIDKIGRKKLVYYGVSGMIVSLLLIAFYFSFGESLGLSSILMLIFFLVVCILYGGFDQCCCVGIVVRNVSDESAWYSYVHCRICIMGRNVFG